MPIVNPKSASVVSPPAPVRISTPDYKTITVDTRYIPNSELIVYMEGSVWTVDYYSQVLDSGNELTGQSPDVNPVFQQYQLVSGFELKVTTPLTANQEQDSNAMVVTGAANVYPMLIPSVGDMFVATIADGRSAVFKVTNTERKSLFKDTAHVIEYVLIDYLTNERKEDFKSKVIKTVKFVRDFLVNGQNPLLVESDYLAQENLKLVYKRIIERYFKAFTSKEFKTLIIPGQSMVCYDPFIVESVLSIFNTFEAEEIRNIKRLNVTEDNYLYAISVWSCLLKQDKSLLKHAFKKTGFVSSRTFTTNAMMESIRYSGVNFIVHPKDAAVSIDYAVLSIEKKPLDTYVCVDNSYEIPTSNVQREITNPSVSDYYIFSEAFYNETENQSSLEVQVWNYLNNKKLDLTVLNTLAINCGNWTPVEQFYNVPVLLLLIKYALGGI